MDNLDKNENHGDDSSARVTGRRGFTRQFFKTALKTLTVSTLWAACKTRNRQEVKAPSADSSSDSSGPVRTPDNEDPRSPNKTEENSDQSQSLQTDGDNKSGCDQSKVNFIEWQKLPDAAGNLDVVYKFYGDTASTMMVIGLPYYQHGALLEIFVVRPSGKMLAGKGIVDPTDIRPDTSLRPVIFDNLQIKSDRQLVIIFKTACSDCEGGNHYSKHAMKYNITFSDTFMGKKVQSLTPTTVPGIFGKYQAYPNISPQEDNTTGYLTTGTYSIASEDALFAGTNELKNYIITDLVGEPLSGAGETFTNIMEYPEFICYRLVDNQFYLRTFVRIV